MADDAAGSTAPPARARDRAFLAAFALVAFLHVLPFWVASIYPLVDMPAHLAMASAYHELDDPESKVHQWFTRRDEFTPYFGYYWFIDVIATVSSVETANRLFLSTYAAIFAAGTVLLAHAFGRTPWRALLAVPFAYPYVFYMGFVPYMMSAAIALLGIAVYALLTQGKIQGRIADALATAIPLAAV